MNSYTLKFLDQRIENEFQSYQLTQLTQHYNLICQYCVFISLAFTIIYVTMEEWILTVIFLFSTFGMILLVYLLRKQKISQQMIPNLFYLFTFYSSTTPFFIQYLAGQKINEIVLIDISALGVFCFIKTSNFTMNLICYYFFICTRIVRQCQESLTQLEIVFFFLSFTIVIEDYYRVKALRHTYLLRKENESQYNILENFCNDKIMITQFNQEKMKFSTILVSNALCKKINNNDCNEILKFIQINQFKQTLHQYLYQKILDKNENNFKVQNLGGKFNKYQSVSVDMQLIDPLEQKIILRISFQQKIVQKDSAALYKNLLYKIKKINRNNKINLIINKHLYNNLISHFALLDINNLKYKVNKTFFDLKFVLSQFSGLEKCIIKNDGNKPMFTDYIILSAMIYLINRIIRIQIIHIETFLGNQMRVVCIGDEKNWKNMNNIYFIKALNRIHSLIGGNYFHISEQNNSKQLKFDINTQKTIKKQ